VPGVRPRPRERAYEHHAHRQAFERDHAKLGRLMTAGYHVLPLPHRQLREERDWVVAALGSLLDADPARLDRVRSAVHAATL
jgi:very-short-patch-repair endonuclease